MTLLSRAALAPNKVLELTRTPLSVEFEAFWRSLPKSGFVPNRSSFLPERASRFLRDLVLCELFLDGQSLVRMRLVGSAFEDRIKRNVKGEDFLQYLPAEFREGAIESVRHIVNRPCGLWQVTPVHFARGYAQNIEFTALPLRPGPDGVHLLLVLTQAVNGLVTAKPTIDKVMMADTALVYRYIDLGAGIPAS